MIKITALLALVALAVWALRRAGPRAAAKLVGWATAVCVTMVLAAGGSEVVRAMRWNSWRMTSGNLWARARDWVFRLVGGAHHADQVRLATVAVIVTIVFAAYLVTRHRRASHPALLVGLTVVAYALGSAYVWPWYVAWGLFPLALCPRAPTTRLLRRGRRTARARRRALRPLHVRAFGPLGVRHCGERRWSATRCRGSSLRWPAQ